MTRNAATKARTRAAARAAGTTYTAALRSATTEHRATLSSPLRAVLGRTDDGKDVALTGGRTWGILGAAGTGKTTMADQILDLALEQGRRVYRIGRGLRSGVVAQINTSTTPAADGPARIEKLAQTFLTDGAGPLLVVDSLYEIDRLLLTARPMERRSADAQRAAEVLTRAVTRGGGRTVILVGAGSLDEPHTPDHVSWWMQQTAGVVELRRGTYSQPWGGVLHEGGRTEFLRPALPLPVRELAVGERVQFAESRRWWRVRAVSPSGRYAGLSSPNNLTGEDFYTIIDRAEQIRGADDIVGGSGWGSDAEFTDHLDELDRGELGISHRNRVPARIAAVRPPDPARPADPPASLPVPPWLSRPVSTGEPGIWAAGQHVQIRLPGGNRIVATQATDQGEWDDPAYYADGRIALVSSKAPAHPDGVVLVADPDGDPVTFDLSAGLLIGDTARTPATVWDLLARQAADAGRTVTIAAARARGPLAEAFPGARLADLADVDGALRAARGGDLLMLADIEDDVNPYRDALAWSQRAAALRTALASGAWVVGLGLPNRYSEPLLDQLPARLAFGRYAARQLLGGGARTRTLPVEGAGLARLAAEGPAIPVRSYT